MKRMLILLSAGLALVGCGGEQDRANAPTKSQSTSATDVATTAKEPLAPKAPDHSPSTAPSKKSVEAPGLVLPDDDSDAVSGKAPELPIR
jgi:hypothetical protein